MLIICNSKDPADRKLTTPNSGDRVGPFCVLSTRISGKEEIGVPLRPERVRIASLFAKTTTSLKYVVGVITLIHLEDNRSKRYRVGFVSKSKINLIRKGSMACLVCKMANESPEM